MSLSDDNIPNGKAAKTPIFYLCGLSGLIFYSLLYILIFIIISLFLNKSNPLFLKSNKCFF